MLDKITKIIHITILILCGITIVGLTLIVAAQVTSRWLGISLPWTEELARFMLIWLTFFGCSLAIKEERHLSVDFFIGLLPKNGQLFFNILTRILMIIFFVILLIYGGKLSIATMETPSTIMQWPMGIVYGAIPLSGCISIFYVILNMIQLLKNYRTESEAKK